MQTSTTATVQVTIAVNVGSSWGDDCSNRQVFDQATRAAKNNVINMIRAYGTKDMQIVGEMKVDAITKAYE